MKFLVVLAVAVACAAADVSHIVKSDESQAGILRSDFDISSNGNDFKYVYETANGISAQAEGSVKNPEAEYPTLVVRGGYKFTAPDGQVVDTQYVSDESGYHVTGSHVPPIPEPIARALAYIAAHPPPVVPAERVYSKP